MTNFNNIVANLNTLFTADEAWTIAAIRPYYDWRGIQVGENAILQHKVAGMTEYAVMNKVAIDSKGYATSARGYQYYVNTEHWSEFVETESLTTWNGHKATFAFHVTSDEKRIWYAYVRDITLKDIYDNRQQKYVKKFCALREDIDKFDF